MCMWLWAYTATVWQFRGLAQWAVSRMSYLVRSLGVNDNISNLGRVLAGDWGEESAARMRRYLSVAGTD